jgi:hypothetical protein
MLLTKDETIAAALSVTSRGIVGSVDLRNACRGRGE